MCPDKRIEQRNTKGTLTFLFSVCPRNSGTFSSHQLFLSLAEAIWLIFNGLTYSGKEGSGVEQAAAAT